jgi:hypothetical protein
MVSWPPHTYSIEVEGEPGFVDIDSGEDLWDESEANHELWTNACDELNALEVLLGEGDLYPPDAYRRLEWQEFATSPPHVQAAILARRVEMLDQVCRELEEEPPPDGWLKTRTESYWYGCWISASANEYRLTERIAELCTPQEHDPSIEWLREAVNDENRPYPSTMAFRALLRIWETKP